MKGITELHGGTVRADSGGIGEGSEFTIRLPVLVPTGPEEAREAVEPRVSARRVLIVDDNRDAAESLADIARMQGHTVEVAYDASTAIEKAHAHPPAIVLCDIGLPDMTGYEVAKALRTLTSAQIQLFGCATCS